MGLIRIPPLARGDRGWEARISGLIDTPKEEVSRLRQRIENAEMFRLRL